MIELRGVELEHPLELALAFLRAYGERETTPRPRSFDEADLRFANRGGARISAAQIGAILERRRKIESALREIDPDVSLAAATGKLPWAALTQLFDAFGGISGVGFSKMTKALHPKRRALIPILDSVVQAYLDAEPDGSFGDRATALVRSYKREIDSNRRGVRELRRSLAREGYRLSEVRILDILIWSAVTAGEAPVAAAARTRTTRT
jgi:Family of unknown function (DUF6308)